MPTISQYRDLLRRFSDDVSCQLVRREVSTFSARRGHTINVSYGTNGWYCDLGDIDKKGVRSPSIYLDRLPGDGQYHWWVGFMTLGASRAERIADHLKSRLGLPIRLDDRRYIYENAFSVMQPPLGRSAYGRPIVELFERGSKSVGTYLGPIGRPTIVSSTVRRQAIRFLAEALSALETWEYRRTEQLPTRVRIVEGIVSSRSFRRDPAQALAAKRRDRFTCRVCRFRPEIVYGVEGRACLEAHHIEALYTRRHVYSELDRLITVCANCHRVLGRLSPDERGLKQLIRSVRSANSRNDG